MFVDDKARNFQCEILIIIFLNFSLQKQQMPFIYEQLCQLFFLLKPADFVKDVLLIYKKPF